MKHPEIDKVIRPLQRLDLIIKTDERINWVDLRSTIIYEIFPEEKYFIVAQTDPPILKSMIGDTIEASFLWYSNPTADPERYAFSTVIQGLLNFQLSLENIVQAVSLSYPDYFYKRNLRFSYRVPPVSEYPIDLQIAGLPQTLPIIDISESGVCFSHPRLPFLEELKKGDRFYIYLNFKNERKKMKILAEVLRKFKKPEKPEISFVAAKFLNLSLAEKEFLAAVIKKIERIILRKRAGLI